MPDDQPPVKQVGKRSVPTPGYRYVGESPAIVVAVYWRPGPYCRLLRRALTRRGIDAETTTSRTMTRLARSCGRPIGTTRRSPLCGVGRRVLTNPTDAQVAALLPARAGDAARLGHRPRSATGWRTRLTGR